MRSDARKNLFPGTPPDVLLARLEYELQGASLALQAGRLDSAVCAIERALSLAEEIRKS